MNKVIRVSLRVLGEILMFYQGISLGKIIKKLPKDMLMIFAFLITIYLTAKELKNAERCGGDKMWYEDVVCQLNKEQVIYDPTDSGIATRSTNKS